MPMDGLTLGFAVREMRKALLGGRIDRVTQPEKDCLILFVRSLSENYRLVLCANPMRARVYMTSQTFENPPEPPMFCMLMRKHLAGGHITAIEQLDGDRVLRVDVENKDELFESGLRSLYMEIMGKHSNLTLVKDGRIVDAIRHVTDDMSRVRQALPGLPFDMPPAQDKLNPDDFTAKELTERLASQPGRADKALSASLRGLSALAAREIALRTTGHESAQVADIGAEELAQRVWEFFDNISQLPPAVLLTDDQGVPCDALPFPYLCCPTDRQKSCGTISAAMDALSRVLDTQSRMTQRTQSLARAIRQHIERSENRMAIAEEALSSGEKMEECRRFGELLTAGLHLIAKGQTVARVPDFYDANCAQVDIPLDASLSPAQNAQKYFKRYQKMRAARELADEQKKAARRELDILESALCDVAQCQCEDDIADVRRVLSDEGLMKRPASERKRPKKPKETVESAFISPSGTVILVGRNSVQNDRLTGAAHGEETWLHAKNMPGSHVIIKADGMPDDETLLMAAQLAAWFSKSRGAPGTPVDYTARKFVKKPGGAPLGFVTYTHQKTLSVGMTREAFLALKTR